MLIIQVGVVVRRAIGISGKASLIFYSYNAIFLEKLLFFTLLIAFPMIKHKNICIVEIDKTNWLCYFLVLCWLHFNILSHSILQSQGFWKVNEQLNQKYLKGETFFLNISL